MNKQAITDMLGDQAKDRFLIRRRWLRNHSIADQFEEDSPSRGPEGVHSESLSSDFAEFLRLVGLAAVTVLAIVGFIALGQWLARISRE